MDNSATLSQLSLPATLCSLTINPSTPSTRHRFFATGSSAHNAVTPFIAYADEPFTGHSAPNARRLLLCTVEELDKLETLVVDEALLSQQLVQDCTEQKIQLSVWH